ncbi:MAG: hypothetical protein F6K19_51470 [Cyanothece sp. SIO1E1]|nr:hypothetical protein [Cyanothece sp. SIO1E1]
MTRRITLLFFLALLVVGCDPFPGEIRSVGRYVSSKAFFADKLISHFPTETPDVSSDPVFSFSPGALQGGAWIQLRVKMDPSDIQELNRKLENETKHKYQGGSFFTHYNLDEDNNLPTASYHTRRKDNDAREFPQHFTLYVLHADDSGDEWNHGETCGIAVSRETNEVIYWAESW